ncbi:hypothetical protein CXT94_03110 [Akkermansia muciniphila]|nr:hypothetical protein CXT94_03110 [Akkermansia muciniphila]
MERVLFLEIFNEFLGLTVRDFNNAITSRHDDITGSADAGFYCRNTLQVDEDVFRFLTIIASFF